MHDTFRIKNFFETQIVLQWNILAMWDKNFSTEKRDTPLSLWFLKLFDTPNFVKHWRDAHERFLLCDTKTIWRENVIPFYA